MSGTVRVFSCAACGRTHFEGGERCGHCGSVLEENTVSGRGRVYSLSVVHIAAGDMTVPYCLVLVDLEESGRVLGRLEESEGEEPAVDDPVVFAGLPETGPHFRREKVSEITRG